MRYYIVGLDTFINIKDCEEFDCGKFSKAINMSFARKHKMSAIDICNKLGFVLKQCPFCKEYVKPDYYDMKVDGSTLTILGVVYRKEFTSCSNKACRSKKINPNSVEFVSTAYGLSSDEALKYIHTRNKSPFYRENHNSEEDYKKYQIRDSAWYNSLR